MTFLLNFQGFNEHVCTIPTSNLVPLIVPANKMFFTTRSHHEFYLSELQKDPFVREFTKLKTLVGYQYLSGWPSVGDRPTDEDLFARWPQNV
jgi:hypothetical protein